MKDELEHIYYFITQLKSEGLDDDHINDALNRIKRGYWGRKRFLYKYKKTHDYKKSIEYACYKEVGGALYYDIYFKDELVFTGSTREVSRWFNSNPKEFTSRAHRDLYKRCKVVVKKHRRLNFYPKFESVESMFRFYGLKIPKYWGSSMYSKAEKQSNI